jgi:DNA-binding transcriptional LysR family regulator
MELRHLRYFVAVAAAESLTVAAKRTQPALFALISIGVFSKT